MLLGTGCGGGDGGALVQVRALQFDTPTVVPRTVAGQSRVRVSAGAPAAPAATASPAVGSPAVQVPHVGSISLGRPNRGTLVNGLQLPATGLYWVTWDPVLHRVPNHEGRRWGSDRLLELLVGVLRDFHLANPTAGPVLVGDLSRPFGGQFGGTYGGLGHASHQNGLDVDVYYPRVDRALRAPERVRDVDRSLAQDLVNRFVAAGAQFAFVGEHLGLAGPPAVVQAIPRHDDHVHVRISNARR